MRSNSGTGAGWHPFRLLARSQTEWDPKRYFVLCFPFLQPRRGFFCPMKADGMILPL